MSMLYLFDGHTNVLVNSGMTDTLYSHGSPQLINGSFVVSVPSGVRLPGNGPPKTLTDLLTQKYQGLLALYPGYTSIVYDDLTDATGFTIGSQTNVTLGARGHISVLNNGIALTNMHALGLSPADCIVTWEVFTLSQTDPADLTGGNRYQRYYTEGLASSLTAEVSFDNGANYTTVTDGALTSIAPGVQGNQLILRFTNSSGSRKWLGSWAVIY